MGEGVSMPDKLLTERARELRRQDTRSEALLWNALRNRKLGGWKWKRQVPRGPFIVDFLCVDAKLVIELDGGQHADREEYDLRRTEWLEASGLKVMRFWNIAVREDLTSVCAAILGACGGDAPDASKRSAE